jgi:hypothetical protein
MIGRATYFALLSVNHNSHSYNATSAEVIASMTFSNDTPETSSYLLISGRGQLSEASSKHFR